MNPGPCITKFLGIIHLNIRRSIRNKIHIGFLNTLFSVLFLIFIYCFPCFFYYFTVKLRSARDLLHVWPMSMTFLSFVFFFSICSIRIKVTQLNTIIHDFDILCFTETYLDCTITNESLMLEGFITIYRKDRYCFEGD